MRLFRRLDCGMVYNYYQNTSNNNIFKHLVFLVKFFRENVGFLPKKKYISVVKGIL